MNAALDWEKIDLNAIVDEDQLWELLASAQEQVQEMAHTAWTQAGKLNSSSGFGSIKEMIPALCARVRLGNVIHFST